MKKKVIWIDTETTGLDYNIHGLREVGFIVEIDGIERERGLLCINTMTYRNEKYISKYVKEEMRVSEELLAKYENSQAQNVAFENILYKYIDARDYKDKFIVAGFNVDFDIGFIKDWFDDLKLSLNYKAIFGYQTLDVLALVRHFKYLGIFETENNKLETLCKYFEIEIDAHEALSDISATKELHEVLVDKFIYKG